MNRIAHDEAPPVVVITREEFEQDLKNGYCKIERSPESEVVIRDKRTGAEHKRIVPQVVIFQCMLCCFNCINGDYLDDKREKTTGAKLIQKHIAGGNHPWRFALFKSPYGHIADVTIEGVDDYTAYLAERRR